MLYINRIGLTGLMVLTLIGTSAAQQQNSALGASPLVIPPDSGLIISPKSKPRRVAIKPKNRRVIAAHSEELPVGSVIYQDHGKLYVVPTKNIPHTVLIFDQGDN
jgi:hypothetical protein